MLNCNVDNHVIKKILTTEEAAEFLSVSAYTLKSWRYRGKIDKNGTKPPKHHKRGRHIYYFVEDLDKWLKKGAVVS